MNTRTVFLIAWFCAVGAAVSFAQAAAEPQPFHQLQIFGQDPEDAYLCPNRYVNAFFGFEFVFPAGANLKPVPQPATIENKIQLLELAGSPPLHAGVSISAYEYKNKNYSDAKTRLRRQLDQELFYGVQELHGMSKTNVGGRPFFYYETRRGVDQHVVLAGEMNGHVLSVDLSARDPQMVHDLFAAFAGAEFFPAQEAQRRAGHEGKPYQGPAISAEHLREVRESSPAQRIEAGKVDGNTYSNQQIGMTYHFPAGWNIEPSGAIEPAVERYRQSVTGEPLLGPRERAIVKACRRTLLSVWRTKPLPDGEVPYDDFGEVTLSAMPLSCFPNIRFPSDPNDSNEVRQFIVGLSFTQPLQRDMNVARTYQVGGRTFVATQGTIAYKTGGDALSRRVSVALAMTEQRGFLLIWLMAAPHEAELRQLLSAKVSFERESEVAGNGVTPGSGIAPQQAEEKSGLTLPPEDSSPNAAPSAAPAAKPDSATPAPSAAPSAQGGQDQTKHPTPSGAGSPQYWPFR